jgi:predicted porin
MKQNEMFKHSALACSYALAGLCSAFAQSSVTIYGATTAMAQVVRVRDRSRYAVDPGSRDATWFAIGAEYALSRRTTPYTSLGSIGNRNGSHFAIGSGTVQQPANRVGAGDPRPTTLAIGMRTLF